MRKRMIFETLHLDVEGGVSERRTTPASNVVAMEASVPAAHTHETHTHGHGHGGLASVAVEIEGGQDSVADRQHTSKGQIKEGAASETNGNSAAKVKPKKKVAFTSDRPDLLDF